MPRLSLQMVSNRRRRLQQERERLQREIRLREQYAYRTKTPIIVQCLGHFAGSFIQPPPPSPPGHNWRDYFSITQLLNANQARITYPMNIWENLIIGLTTQQPWIQTWAMLMSNAQHERLRGDEIKHYMLGLRMNGLCLLLPPAMITNFSPAPYGPHSPIDPTVLMTTDFIRQTPWEHKLKGHKLSGLFLVASWTLRSIDASVITSLQLETGFLDYSCSFNPIREWGDNGPSLWFEDSDSSSSSDVERNRKSFPDDHILMEPIKIMAWNARGAASQEF